MVNGELGQGSTDVVGDINDENEEEDEPNSEDGEGEPEDDEFGEDEEGDYNAEKVYPQATIELVTTTNV